MPQDYSTVVADLPAADVCVLVVSFNSARDLPDLLDSLGPAADGLRLRVVIVDNGSEDDSVEVARGRGAIAVRTGINLGYAGGINVGRPWSQGCESILVANPDLTFGRMAIRLMHEAAQRDCAVIVPTILGPDGERRASLQREPTVLRQLGEALFGDRLPNRPSWLAITVRAEDQYISARTVDWASGAALLIPREVDAATGPWDEDYFLYSEEVDFARQVRARGFRMLLRPDAVAVHSVGGSGSSDRLFALNAVNRIRYFAKWHGRLHCVVYGLAVMTELLLRASRPAQRAAIPDVARAIAVAASRGKWSPGGELIGVSNLHGMHVLEIPLPARRETAPPGAPSATPEQRSWRSTRVPDYATGNAEPVPGAPSPAGRSSSSQTSESA